MEMSVFELRRAINEYAGEKLKLVPMHGKGDYNVFIAIDQRGEKKFIIKVGNRRKNAIAKRIITNQWPWYEYINSKERFEREDHILSKLSMHGLAPRPIFFNDKYSIEEYVPGRKLPDIIVTLKENKTKVIIDILFAISRMHSYGISHGDLNPHNILVADRGIKFIDFEYKLNPETLTNIQMNAFDYLRFLRGIEEINEHCLLSSNEFNISGAIFECLACDAISRDDIRKTIDLFKYNSNMMRYFDNI